MSGRLTAEIECSMLIPILLVFEKYFNDKYPCTDESNDGSNMPPEDEVKYSVYNYLLSIHIKLGQLSASEYAKVVEQAKKQLETL